jgi:hypothetical protein
MNAAKGYYCLIQYCPDLGRLEAANVGVLLFCPERLFLKAKTAGNNRRIIQFFGRSGHDWDRINSLKRGIEERLSKENADIRNLEDLQRFIALRANVIQITPPRPIKVLDPERDLEQLSREFLGGIAHRTNQRSLRRYVQERLYDAGLQDKLQTDIRVQVPLFKKEVEVPFGYQNGRFNLLTPVPFTAKDLDHSVHTACKYAVEGESLNETPHPDLGPLQFCVIGHFRPNDRVTSERVEAVLSKYNVKLYRTSRMTSLVEEIKRTGKVVRKRG